MNRKEFYLTGSWMSYSAPFPGKEWKLTADCFADGRLKFDPSMIFRKYPLSQVADAFALYKNPRDVHGKIMLSCCSMRNNGGFRKESHAHRGRHCPIGPINSAVII